MGVEVKLKTPVEQPVEAVEFTSSLGTRKLTFRQDSSGEKRVTIEFKRWASRRAATDGRAPLTEVKSSVYPNEIRELAKALFQLADSIDQG